MFARQLTGKQIPRDRSPDETDQDRAAQPQASTDTRGIRPH
jgi:hypothetical protein